MTKASVPQVHSVALYQRRQWIASRRPGCATRTSIRRHCAHRRAQRLAISRKWSGVIGAMKKVLAFAAVAEVFTGLALLIVPSLVGKLLLGAELAGVAVPIARVTGIALLALGIACWPGP